jgi:hypothetical protein
LPLVNQCLRIKKEDCVLFYLTVLAVGGSLAITAAAVILALLTFTSDERCHTIEQGVKARLARTSSRQKKARAPKRDNTFAAPRTPLS